MNIVKHRFLKMKHQIMLLLFLLPFFVVAGDGKVDSTVVLYKSSTLIEIITPFYPEINKRKRHEYHGPEPLDGAYLKINYGVLKNGEIKVYNRFFELDTRQVFRDSVLYIEESFYKGELTTQSFFFHEDSIEIHTNFGLKWQHQKLSPAWEITTQWYPKTDKIESRCERNGDTETCDYWDEDGYFLRGIIREYCDNEMISEIEVNEKGEFVKRIR